MLGVDENSGSSETGDSTSVQANKRLGNEFWQDGDQDPEVYLPEHLKQILSRITDCDLVEELKQFMVNSIKELSKREADRNRTRSELEEIRDKLQRTETELSDLQSAAALTVAGQNDAIDTLKRQYDEELASWRSISEQQISEAAAANQRILECERAHWAGERDALLSRFNSVQRKSSLEEGATVANAGPLTVGGAPAGGPTAKFFSVSDRLSGQNLANQALESVERMARRVGQKFLASSLMSEDEPDSSSFINDHSNPQALRAKLELHEREVFRLRQLLSEATSAKMLASPAEKISTTDWTTDVDAAPTSADSTDQQDLSLHISGDRTKQPDQLGDNKVDSIHDVSTPITEESWIQIQSKLKEMPRQTCSPCVMCTNYEQQLQHLQSKQQESDKNLQALSKELHTKTTELNELLQIRNQLESDLKSRSSDHNERMRKLESQFSLIQTRMENLLNDYRAHRQATETELARLSNDRRSIQAELNTLQAHYDSLLGRRAAAAKELSEQPIQLPSSKADLELLALRMYEENLSLREAREHLDEKLKSDSQFHQQQLIAERQERLNLENTLQRELDEAHARLTSLTGLEKQRDSEAAARFKAEDDVKSARAKLAEVQAKLLQAEEDASSARTEVETLQKRVLTLQADLNNVESVQADFVRLSQNLQVQLERLRQQDHEVRWVDPDDVKSCFACDCSFLPGSNAVERKANCRHCGKVHCSKCLQNSMPSGPLGRQAPVCDVCYTLLNKHVAPYFSTSFQDPTTGAQIRVGSPNALQHSANNSNTPTSATNKNKTKSSSNSPHRGRNKIGLDLNNKNP